MKFPVGQLHRAIDHLFSLGPATESVYTHLALQCLRANDIQSAKRLQSHMENNLYQHKSPFILNRLLQLYTISDHYDDAQKLFDKMLRKDLFSWNIMLFLYSKTGSVRNVQKTFEEMPLRNRLSFNTLISCLAKGGYGTPALGAFVRMMNEGFVPDERTHVSILNACTRLQDIKLGKQVHGIIITKNLICNSFVANSLVNMYSKWGEPRSSKKVFVEIKPKNATSWNALIGGYLSSDRPEECISLFYEMRSLGFDPDSFTVCNILVACFKCKYIEQAQQLFASISPKDKFSWTTMIAGYVENGMEIDALMMYNKMMQQCVDSDSHTISIIVTVVSKLAHLSLGRSIHGKSIRLGVDEETVVSSALVDMYSKCGSTEDALKVFDKMPKKSVVSWNTMIRGYARNGKTREALKLYDQMVADKCMPDGMTFMAVLSACANDGSVDKGRELFGSMGGLGASAGHYACMVSMLGRRGHVDEAVELVNAMTVQPNHYVWSNLLSISVMNKDIRNGEVAANHLIEIDPQNAWACVMLSNVYSACGRWLHFAATRLLIKSLHQKKFAAYSWIYVGSELHQFQANDHSHPHSALIYLNLETLHNELHMAET